MWESFFRPIRGEGGGGGSSGTEVASSGYQQALVPIFYFVQRPTFFSIFRRLCWGRLWHGGGASGIDYFWRARYDIQITMPPSKTITTCFRGVSWMDYSTGAR